MTVNQAPNVISTPPRLVVSAPQGRSGKTTASIGLCASLQRRGLVVQPFKKGPDYIDPSWLTAAAGRTCRNLDTVLMSEATMQTSFQEACRGVDVVVIEGAMGFYDGLGTDGRGSTAHIARLLGSPVILLVNASRMTHSAAAMVSGYQHFEPDANIKGVILNNVSGSRHEAKLKTAIEHYCQIPVVGSIPRDPGLNIAERHLGLIPFAEGEDSPPKVERIRRLIEPHLDLDAILDIARGASSEPLAEPVAVPAKPASVKVGVVFDRVFHFYYPENLEALTDAGAQLVFIDSLRDKRLPEIDALYIGGGFPELFLAELEANIELRQHIAQAIEDNMPVYAECAGLMYLCRSIRWQAKWHEMVGVLPAEVEIEAKPQGHGYVAIEVTAENSLLPIGLKFWGHEFHHSRVSNVKGLDFAYRVQRGYGIDGKRDGVVFKNVLAAYTHLNALGVPRWAEALVLAASRWHYEHRSLAVIKG